LQQVNEVQGVEGGLGGKLKQRAFFMGIDLSDSQGSAQDAQAMAFDQRMGFLRQQTEAIDQFFLKIGQCIDGVTVGQTLV